MKTTLKKPARKSKTWKKPPARPQVAQLSEDLEIAKGKIEAQKLEIVRLKKLLGIDSEPLRKWAWERDYVQVIDLYLAEQQDSLWSAAAKLKEEIRGRRVVGLQAALEEYEKTHPEVKVSIGGRK